MILSPGTTLLRRKRDDQLSPRAPIGWLYLTIVSCEKAMEVSAKGKVGWPLTKAFCCTDSLGK